MKRNNKLKVELFTHTEKSAILTVVEIIYCIIEKEKKEMESCSSPRGQTEREVTRKIRKIVEKLIFQLYTLFSCSRLLTKARNLKTKACKKFTRLDDWLNFTY